MKLVRILSLGAGLGLLATLGGCVVAPVGPPPGGAYVGVAPVVVAPAPHYYYRGYYGGPRYYRY